MMTVIIALFTLLRYRQWKLL